MPVRSGWLSPDSQSREDTRLVSLGALTPTSPVATRSGVLPGSSEGLYRIAGFTLTGTSNSMSATVSPGRAVLQSTDVRGAYPVALTEYVPLTFADGDPLYSRIDVVVLRIYDDVYDASTTGSRTEAVVEIVPGTPAAAPVLPPLPGLCLPLYQVPVAAKASAGTGGIAWSSTTDRRTATVGVGGILPVVTDTTGGAYPGQYRDLGGQLQRWSGTAWTDYPVLPTWQSWTPGWTTGSGLATPSYGNSVLNCRYVKFGTTVHLSFSIQFGTTTNFGTSPLTSDNWRFGLPASASAVHQMAGWAEVGASNGARAMCRIYLATTDTFELGIASGRPDATAIVTPTWGTVDSLTPWTWASGQAVRGTATYEAAS